MHPRCVAPSEKPETQGVAETAPTVSALCYHRSRSAGPHRARRRRRRHCHSSGRRPLDLLAITRVEGRERLLIFRPLALAPFQRGGDLGRNLLLRVWREEAIDWEQIRAEYIIENAMLRVSRTQGVAWVRQVNGSVMMRVASVKNA